MYVRGYLQGSENGRVITIDGEHFKKISTTYVALWVEKILKRFNKCWYILF
jgi:hypothetical protein